MSRSARMRASELGTPRSTKDGAAECAEDKGDHSRWWCLTRGDTSVVARPPTKAGAGPGQDVNGPLRPVWQSGPQRPASRARDVGYFLNASFTSPAASLTFSPACFTEDSVWSERP